MAVVPGVECAVLWVIVNLCGISVVVHEGQAWHHLSVCVRIKSIANGGVYALIAVHSIQDTTDDKAVPVAVSPQARPPCGLLLQI